MASSTVVFHHVHLYADELSPYDHYKKAEDRFSVLSGITEAKLSTSARRAAWAASGEARDPAKFSAPNQDLVDQMIHGLGWRITGSAETAGTRTFLLSSEDSNGVKFVISAKNPSTEPAAAKKSKQTHFDHFDSGHIDRFYAHQAGRQGCAVLAFEVTQGGVATIEAKYRAKHPTLLPETPTHEYPGFKILEVYAYYKGEIGGECDKGTMLRFIEKTSDSEDFLPGLAPIAAQFDGTSCGAYFDHWVSNVVSRTGFLQTLEDTLDFSIKVDFNAGVVAAGRAQIESTVTGNSSKFQTDDTAKSLVDQSQVFLPINNALSEVGHVHFYLEQIGQGIQHLASRVDDLSWFISRVNAYREITGTGFTFLNIPPSYYGRLVIETLTEKAAEPGLGISTPVSRPLGEAVMAVLKAAGIVDEVGIVKLEVTPDEVHAALEGKVVAELQAELKANADNIATAVVRGVYSNMYKLLRENLNAEQYVDIVRNKILIDIQDGDILYQIFSCTVLQRNADDEAPFLEFIQRVCSNRVNADGTRKPIAPGCGGFGIRNFLTLFLSIEVSKAMSDLKGCMAGGDDKGAALAKLKIEIFTSQLDKANPILTNISDAMSEAGQAKTELEGATTDAARATAQARLDAAKAKIETNNAALQTNSSMHSDLMLTAQNDADAAK